MITPTSGSLFERRKHELWDLMVKDLSDLNRINLRHFCIIRNIFLLFNGFKGIGNGSCAHRSSGVRQPVVCGKLIPCQFWRGWYALWRRFDRG